MSNLEHLDQSVQMHATQNYISSEALHSALKENFGFDSFRLQQEEIIASVLAGSDALVVMPTGGGKSICYQLPALFLSGVTLVISPLIALMKDQVDALLQNGIQAGLFHSLQTQEEKQAIFQSLNNKQIKLIYTAPESLDNLFSFLNLDDISLIAIDEAHCISAWGHDFRPAYTNLARLKSIIKAPIVALTATADKTTREDILNQLDIGKAKVFLSSFNRENLFLEVRSGKKRVEQILNFLKQHKNESGIIYCLSRKGTEKLAERLLQQGYKAVVYHAGLTSDAREESQNLFIKDEVNIICATVAFGMGIDKSNVRWVIHYNLPKNIEGYYQEIGRAGRDGLPAKTLLFYTLGDFSTLRKFALSENPQQQQLQLAKLERMLHYAQALSCRRKILLSYFGEHSSENCQNCDVCLNPPEQFDATIIAQKALSAIARLKENETLNVVIDLLRGSNNHYILSNNYHNLKTFGVGKDLSLQNWQEYLIQLINQGFIELDYKDNQKLKLTQAGKGVLFSNEKVRLAKFVELKQRTKAEQKTSYEESEPMFDMLRNLRKELADKENVPPFLVFSDASLRDMMRIRPETKEDFLSVSGVGQVKLERYGDFFIRAIEDYLNENPEEKAKQKVAHKLEERDLEEENLEIDTKANKRSYAKKSEPKKIQQFYELDARFQNQGFEKMDTLQISVELYKRDFGIDAIAEIRNLTRSTILNHLIKAYETKTELDLEKLINSEDLAKIQTAKQELESPDKLRPYYEHLNENLNENIDYDTIRIGLAILQKNQS